MNHIYLVSLYISILQYLVEEKWREGTQGRKTLPDSSFAPIRRGKFEWKRRRVYKLLYILTKISLH